MATHNRQTPPTATKLVSPVQRIPEQSVAAPEAEPSEQTSTPGLAGHLHGQQQARMMQRMQRAVGNAQVQRMLKAAPAQQRTSITPPAVARSTIAPVQRTAAPTATIQRSPETQVAAPASVPVQRTAAPIQRGWRDWGRNALNAGKSFVNTVGNAGQQGAKFLFEQALSKAGVDPKRVMSLINRAGGAVGSIISNPGRFATTLVNAVRQGFGKFQGNIGTHLQAGFSGWLLGTTGVTVPKDFSPPSVLSLVLQVLKITSATIQQRLARQIGDKNAARMEQAWGVIGSAMSKGPGGLWTMLKEYLGDLKTVVIDGIKEWVIGSVVKAAVGKIASMFSPATGMIAAIKTIYDVATFLIERAGQLKQLFQAVGDSASALAQGNTQQAASKIEQTLARAIPVAIGFLASLVGLRNVAAKVKEIIGRVRDRIQGAIDKLIAKVLSKFKGPMQKAGGNPTSTGGDTTASAADAQRRLRQGMSTAVAVTNKFSGKRVSQMILNPLVSAIRIRYRLGVLKPIPHGDKWAIHGEIQRTIKDTSALVEKPISAEGDTLLVGEGNFSFAKSLAQQTDPQKRSRMTASSYESLEEIQQKYRLAKQHIDALRSEYNVQVKGKIDATKLHQTPGLGVLDTIIWNFPHSGSRAIRTNQDLLRNFFGSAKQVLKPGGKIYVTLKHSSHYKGWHIEQQAQTHGLLVVKVTPIKFQQLREAYPGYEHKETLDDKSADIEEAVTYVFQGK
jgi:hypothetical protein